MFGVLALYLGIEPLDGDVNNLIPQMAGTYLPAILVALFFLLVLGALSSTADSDLAALSSIVMTDGYGHTVAGRSKADPRRMLLIGPRDHDRRDRTGRRVRQHEAEHYGSAGVRRRTLGRTRLPGHRQLLLEQVSNKAFTVATISAVATFLPVRFGWLPTDGASGFLIDVASIVGVGVVAGLMAFGFFGLRIAKIVGIVAVVVTAPFGIGFLHDYATLSGSLVAYAVSTVVCFAMSVRNPDTFDFATIEQRVGDFDRPTGADDDRPTRDETPARK